MTEDRQDRDSFPASLAFHNSTENTLIKEPAHLNLIPTSQEIDEASTSGQEGKLNVPCGTSSETTRVPVHKVSLLEFLRDFKALPVPVVRTLFKKIVGEIVKLHSKGSYHGDLGLENIYFDQEYNVLLSQRVQVCESFLDGVSVDLICLGEILFALCFGSLPYISLEDERYAAILNGDWELFWKINEKSLKIEKRGFNLTKSGLKDLITVFFAGQGKSKYDVFQLFAHEWMNGTTLTSKQVKNLLDEVRKKMVKAV